MTCSVCGYAMSAFDTGCPRCAQQKAEQPAQQSNAAQPAPAPTQAVPQAQGGWTQPGQPPQPQPYHAPPQGYQPQPPGYPPASVHPIPAKKGMNPVIIVVLVLFALCSLPTVFISLALVGKKVSETTEKANTTIAAPQQQNSSATTPQIRIGPSFTEVDSKMDDRLTQWTDAQKEAYWATVQGTQISWSGEVIEVKLDRGGSVSLKCNPKSFASDVMVNLDGSQLDKLPTISKGQRITIEGILKDHSMFGYTISNARVSGI